IGPWSTTTRTAAAIAAAATSALARIDLIGQPLGVSGERSAGGVWYLGVLVGFEIQEMQDRLGVGRLRVRVRDAVDDPFAVTRDVLSADAAPLRVVVNGQHFLRRRLRGGQRIRGTERDRQGGRQHSEPMGRTNSRRGRNHRLTPQENGPWILQDLL